MDKIIDRFGFSDPNVQMVVIACMILGSASAIVGVFAFLRKRALLGDAIAHSILPGICLAFIISGTKNPFYLILGALVSAWVSIVFMDALVRTSKIKNDAAIGITLSVFFGIGILLLTSIQHSGNANQAGLESILFGQAAALSVMDIYTFSILGILLISTVCLLFKEFKLISFNPEYAKVIGLPIKWLEFILSTITILAVALGIQAVGVVLMAALLITPAAAARYWSNNLIIILLLSAFFGAFAAFIGSMVSYLSIQMPTGPWVVVVLSIIAMISIFFAPKKGLLYRNRNQRKNRLKILLENILKTFYQLGERENDFQKSRKLEELILHRKIDRKELISGLKRLKRKNLLRNKEEMWILTNEGLREAKRMVKLHRLWEMYLSQRLNLKADHVHHDAEAIEHIITPELEQQLERELDFPTKDPHQSNIPYSTN